LSRAEVRASLKFRKIDVEGLGYQNIAAKYPQIFDAAYQNLKPVRQRGNSKGVKFISNESRLSQITLLPRSNV
jgi:hypothetical protein